MVSFVLPREEARDEHGHGAYELGKQILKTVPDTAPQQIGLVMIVLLNLAVLYCDRALHGREVFGVANVTRYWHGWSWAANRPRRIWMMITMMVVGVGMVAMLPLLLLLLPRR